MFGFVLSTSSWFAFVVCCILAVISVLYVDRPDTIIMYGHLVTERSYVLHTEGRPKCIFLLRLPLPGCFALAHDVLAATLPT